MPARDILSRSQTRRARPADHLLHRAETGGPASLTAGGRSRPVTWLDGVVAPRERAATWLALAAWFPFLLVVACYRAKATFPPPAADLNPAPVSSDPYSSIETEPWLRRSWPTSARGCCRRPRPSSPTTSTRPRPGTSCSATRGPAGSRCASPASPTTYCCARASRNEISGMDWDAAGVKRDARLRSPGKGPAAATPRPGDGVPPG
jgi:hypothetical protein